MKGYPKHIASKQDFINLLADKEYRERAIADLRIIAEADDDKAMRTISINEETGEEVTEEIDNPMPLWKVKGFKSRKDVAELIAAQEG